MNKLQQGAYCLRDYLYTMILALFGWTLADFSFLMSNPLEAISSFFNHFWGIAFAVITLAGYLIEMIFCPARLHPVDEVPKPWRRWRGLLMEANLVPAIFCDHLNLLQISQDENIRYVGAALYLFTLLLTALYGVERRKQIKAEGENTFSTRGLFRLIRYPEYLAQLIYSFSIPLFFNSWIGWVATAVHIVSMVKYLNRLDQVMEKKYRNSWASYAEGSKKLIPYLY